MQVRKEAKGQNPISYDLTLDSINKNAPGSMWDLVLGDNICIEQRCLNLSILLARGYKFYTAHWGIGGSSPSEAKLFREKINDQMELLPLYGIYLLHLLKNSRLRIMFDFAQSISTELEEMKEQSGSLPKLATSISNLFDNYNDPTIISQVCRLSPEEKIVHAGDYYPYSAIFSVLVNEALQFPGVLANIILEYLDAPKSQALEDHRIEKEQLERELANPEIQGTDRIKLMGQLARNHQLNQFKFFSPLISPKVPMLIHVRDDKSYSDSDESDTDDDALVLRYF